MDTVQNSCPEREDTGIKDFSTIVGLPSPILTVDMDIVQTNNDTC